MATGIDSNILPPREALASGCAWCHAPAVDLYMAKEAPDYGPNQVPLCEACGDEAERRGEYKRSHFNKRIK